MSKAMVIGADVQGVEASIAQLRALAQPDELGVIMDNALEAGGEVIAEEWSRRAPAQSLKTTYVRKGIAAARALRISYKKLSGVAVVAFGGKGYRLAHLFEYGTSERRQYTTGRKTGRMPARPFARPGVDAVLAETQETIKMSLQKAINQKMKKR